MECYLDLEVVGVLETSSGVMILESNFEDWIGDVEKKKWEYIAGRESGVGHSGPSYVQGQIRGG